MLGGFPLYYSTLCTLVILGNFRPRNVSISKEILSYVAVPLALSTLFSVLYWSSLYVLVFPFNRMMSIFFALYALSSRELLSEKVIRFSVFLNMLLVLWQFYATIVQLDLTTYNFIIYDLISQSQSMASNENNLNVWRLARYYGAFGNPNSFGINATMLLLLYELKFGRNRIVLLGVGVCVLLSFSKLAFVCLALWMTRDRKYWKYMLLGLTFLVFLPSSERVLDIYRYTHSAIERSGGYEQYILYLSDFSVKHIFGNGLNIIGLRGKLMQELTMSNTGFVSNSILLTYSFTGLIGILGWTILFIKGFLSSSRDNFLSLLLVLIVAMGDNMLSILDGFTVIILVLLSLSRNDIYR